MVHVCISVECGVCCCVVSIVYCIVYGVCGVCCCVVSSV